MEGERLNYGMAISSTGEFQIIDTVHSPCIRDDYSITLSGSFTYFVVPHHLIDKHFKIYHLKGNNYSLMRDSIIKWNGEEIKNVILDWYGIKSKKHTW
jgi:hypothetical protein